MQHLLYKNFIVKRQKKIRKYNNYKSTRYCMKIKKIKFHKKIIMFMNILFNKLYPKKNQKIKNYKTTHYCMKIKRIIYLKYPIKIIVLMKIIRIKKKINKLHTKKDIILLHLEYKNVIVKKSK